MSDYSPLAPCTYREVVALLPQSATAPDGFDVIVLNGKGQATAGVRSIMPGKKARIAVNREFYRSISDATKRLKEQIEPILFSTRETVTFNLDMRIGTSRDRTIEIAEKHFHESKGPEQVFYAYFGNQFRLLLEDSAKQHTGDIDARIARNKDAWEAFLKKKLEERFAVQVELNFLIEKEIAQDKSIATEPAAPLHVTFNDRIDHPVPLRIDLRLRHRDGNKSSIALPRNETTLRNSLFAVVRQACARDLKLFDYWYRPEEMRRVITANLNAHLDEYAYEVSNLVVVRDDSEKAPPPQSVKLDARIWWHDSRGYRLEFRAEAIARLDEQRAGLYDRTGRPDRARWFEETITDSLKHVLAGVAINDLGENQIENYSDLVRRSISDRAEAIGLRLDVFFGSVFLPLQDWLKVRRVSVPEGSYPTAHPKIEGNFTMDMEVEFETRRALEPFFVQYARSGNTGKNDLPDDTFIREKLIEAARDAAELVMQTTPAEIYFSTYIGAAKWDASLPGLPDPGGDEGDDNLIFAKLKSILENSYPGVLLRKLHFHRLDRGLEKLRQVVAQIRTVEFECDLRDRLHGDAGRDRLLKGYITIETGDAERVVMMMNKDLHLLSPEEFRARIARHLKIVVANRLSHVNAAEVESLMRSLTAIGRRFDDQTAMALHAEIRSALREDFGIIPGRIEFHAELSAGEKMVRETMRDINLLPTATIARELASLQRQLNGLLSEREIITETTTDDNQRRLFLTERIEETKRAIADLRQGATDAVNRRPSDVMRQAGSAYLDSSIADAFPLLPAAKETQSDGDENHTPERGRIIDSEDDTGGF